MAEISRSALFGRLAPSALKSIETAFGFTKLRGNPYVELVHWLHTLNADANGDFAAIKRHFNLDDGALGRDTVAALDGLPRGASSVDLSVQVEEAVEKGWLYASLMFGANKVRSGHLLYGILKTPNLKNVLFGVSNQYRKIDADKLGEGFGSILGSTVEASEGGRLGAGGTAAGGGAPDADGDGEPSGDSALARFSVDLTAKARSGEIDKIVGRDAEIRQCIDILLRRRQNNPILTGEAGVGKTAVVEGFARRIADGDVPPVLRDVTLRSLDIGLLSAGASVKGEFEKRLRAVIDEVEASPKPVILFIDEAHTLIGAGGAAGTGDAANLLKPALARGKLRTIAATTWAEYRQYFEKDPALTRRFQVVQVDEPSEEKAILMMRGIAGALEKHHRVQILDDAIEAAVRLSHRYIPARQLPDKSVSLLDTASARVAVSQHAVPAAVDDSRRRIQAFETELQIIAREHAIGIDTDARRAEAETKLTAERERVVGLEARWQEEKVLVDELLTLRAALRDAGAQPDAPEDGRDARLAEVRALQAKLSDYQGESPLILPSVDAQAIAAIVGDWTGIPVGRMMKNEVQAVLNLASTLGRRVVGQDHGLQMIARRVQTSRAGLDNPSKPVGVFMLCGPSGVGKTETALTLAEALYGGEQNLITINMSEFQEAHTVSTLKGAPPGYVGYGEGGVLTEAVRRKPYSVVLLDEVEKAHPDVHEIFFQVFDKGVMEDGEGRVIDFKNTLILLTSNVGTDLIMDMCRDPELIPEPEDIAKALRTPLLKMFPPALLGRLIVIPYYPLSDSVMAGIIRMQLGRIATRIGGHHKVPFTFDEDVVSLIAARCTEPESGGRMIDAILTNTMLPAISQAFLEHAVAGKSVARVHVGVREGEFTYDFD